MTITIPGRCPEALLTELLEAAREASSSPGHYHIRKPYECEEGGCLGIHPAIALARACRRTEKQARSLLTHTHRWLPFLDGAICSECGQTSYTSREAG